MKSIIITGASGFLGKAIINQAKTLFPNAEIIPISSPRAGGIDLCSNDATKQLSEKISLSDPANTILIHAAASVKWFDPEGLLENAAMAINLATWARNSGIGFSVLVSGVNVYSQSLISVDDTTWAEPSNLYGAGKIAAENVWKIVLEPEKQAILRIAGIWGWQIKPTLFWNRMLLAAAKGNAGQVLQAKRLESYRNYISAEEASECLIRVAENKLSGVFIASGRDTISTAGFIHLVSNLPESKLEIEIEDDGQKDEQVYHPSKELLRWLKPFPEVLTHLWENKPSWINEV